MNTIQTAMAAAGLIPSSVAVPTAQAPPPAPVAVSAPPPPAPAPVVVNSRQKLAELNHAPTWSRFVRRTGGHDQIRFSVNSVDFFVTLRTEKSFLVQVNLPGRKHPAYHTGNITPKGVVVSGVLAEFHGFERRLIDELHELIVKASTAVPSPSGTGTAVGGTIQYRRAHWRQLTGANGFIAHSFPPAELVAMGVPLIKQGYTFVHEYNG